MAPHYSSLFTQNRQRERKYGMTHGFNPAEAWVREILSLPRLKLLDGVNQAKDETKELWWWFHNSDKRREWLSQLLVTLTKGRRLGDRVAGIRTGYFSVFHHDQWLRRTSCLDKIVKLWIISPINECQIFSSSSLLSCTLTWTLGKRKLERTLNEKVNNREITVDNLSLLYYLELEGENYDYTRWKQVPWQLQRSFSI